MVEETILQHPIFVKFILPFALVVALIYALLEKTKLFGENKHQLNAIIAFIVGLLFTSVLSPTLIIQNMVLFLSIAIVMLFVIILLWGFIFGGKDEFKLELWMKWILGIVVSVAFVVGVLWATGVKDKILDLLFRQSWSDTFWTNFLFVIVIVIVLVVILANKGKLGQSGGK